MAKGELDIDPRGLIQEAYRMAIGPAECRSVFLDWALGLPSGVGHAEVARLLDRYGPTHPDHPMTAVLREGATPEAPTHRRRGRRRQGRGA